MHADMYIYNGCQRIQTWHRQKLNFSKRRTVNSKTLVGQKFGKFADFSKLWLITKNLTI